MRISSSNETGNTPLRRWGPVAPLILWTVGGAAAAYWGYRDIMASCPAFDDFAGCFEPPCRFSAMVALIFWVSVEVVFLLLWLGLRPRRNSA